jgi:hypothetical protein
LVKSLHNIFIGEKFIQNSVLIRKPVAIADKEPWYFYFRT